MASLQRFILLLVTVMAISIEAKYCPYHGYQHFNYPDSEYLFVAYNPYNPYQTDYQNDPSQQPKPTLAAVQVHQSPHRYDYTVDEEGPHHKKFIYQEFGYPTQRHY